MTDLIMQSTLERLAEAIEYHAEATARQAEAIEKHAKALQKLVVSKTTDKPKAKAKTKK